MFDLAICIAAYWVLPALLAVSLKIWGRLA
jgi:hypothetical protein